MFLERTFDWQHGITYINSSWIEGLLNLFLNIYCPLVEGRAITHQMRPLTMETRADGSGLKSGWSTSGIVRIIWSSNSIAGHCLNNSIRNRLIAGTWYPISRELDELSRLICWGPGHEVRRIRRFFVLVCLKFPLVFCITCLLGTLNFAIVLGTIGQVVA